MEAFADSDGLTLEQSKGLPTLRAELRRAFGNRWFVISLCLLLAIAVVDAVTQISTYTERLDVVVFPYLDTSYWYLSSFSSFTRWIAVNHIDIAVELFFILAPLIVTVGYSWSLASDIKSGYIEQLVIRTSRTRCYIARMIAVFCTGGTLAAIPLLVNYGLLSLFLPSWTPSLVDQFYTSVGGTGVLENNAIFTSLFYSHPLLFVIARTALDFILCGLWSTTVLALSFWTRNRVALVVTPYLGLLVIKHLGQGIYTLLRTHGFEGFGYSITLFDQLRAAPDRYFCPGWVTVLCALLILGLSLALPYLARKRDVL